MISTRTPEGELSGFYIVVIFLEQHYNLCNYSPVTCILDAQRNVNQCKERKETARMISLFPPYPLAAYGLAVWVPTLDSLEISNNSIRIREAM